MSDVVSQVAQQADLEATFGPHLLAVCERAAQALQATGYRSLLVHSGSPLMVFEDDRTYPFETHAPFKVWVPLDVADCFIFFAPGQRPRLLLHSPPDYWYKPAAVPQTYWTQHFDIRPVSSLGDARQALPRELAHTAYIGDEFAQLPGWGVGCVNAPRLKRHLDFGRAAKTGYELVCLRAANRLGARGHRAAQRAFAAGGSEFEIELAFLRACGLREQELPYNPIIALNEGGAVLHYQVLAKTPPPQRHSLLIDAGAEFAGYASDITRTHAHSDGDFAALIQRLDELQLTLCASVRAGVDWRAVQLHAHQLTAALLRDAQIINCSAEEAIARNITTVFLPHGIGHLLGIEVHDVGGFMSAPDGPDIPAPDGHPFLRLTRVLQPGFVVTMEPGIYFIASLLQAAQADARAAAINWRLVAQLRRYGGIRVEDNLAITATGCENLTRDAFAADASLPA